MAGSSRELNGLRVAVERGVARLEAAARHGRWSAFRTAAGHSDVWVTAFVVAHLQSICPRAELLAQARRFLLAQQQRSGGWGFGNGVPADADSTAWCLSALSPCRSTPRTRIARAERFLRDHWRDWGFATYTAVSGIREFVEAPEQASMAGWMSPHADVTAAVLAALRPARRAALSSSTSLPALLGKQTAAGLIESYWWRSPFYALALTLRALRVHRRRPGPSFIERTRERLKGSQLPDGGYGLGAEPTLDPFTTALGLEACCHLSSQLRAVHASRAAEALQGAQRRDGSWSGAYVLRIPAPQVIHPHFVNAWQVGGGGGNALVHDDEGIFATALSCHALQLRVRILEKRYGGLDRDWPLVEALPPDLGPGVAVMAPVIRPEVERCSTSRRASR